MCYTLLHGTSSDSALCEAVRHLLRVLLRGGFQESLPAFVAMITMPFTFSIGYGIIAGLGLWISIQLLLAPLRLYRGESPWCEFTSFGALPSSRATRRRRAAARLLPAPSPPASPSARRSEQAAYEASSTSMAFHACIGASPRCLCLVYSVGRTA